MGTSFSLFSENPEHTDLYVFAAVYSDDPAPSDVLTLEGRPFARSPPCLTSATPSGRLLGKA